MLKGLNYQRGETKSLPRLTRRRITRGGVWGPPPENFQILHLAGQDFQHILKRISLEIAVILGFFRNKAISFNLPKFPSISFRFEFPYNFLQLVKISFKKEISLKMEALSVCIIIVFSTKFGMKLGF